MNEKLKKTIIPFILMVIVDLGTYYFFYGENLGGGLTLHVGLLLISGLILGPYGAIGAVAGNLLCDLIRGYALIPCLLSLIINFGISYLGYKLWYANFQSKRKVTNPKLNSTTNILLFLAIVILCGVLYSFLSGGVIYLTYTETDSMIKLIELRYILNFTNSSIIFGIIGIWISNRLNFFHIPTTSSENRINTNVYRYAEVLLVLSLIITFIINYLFGLNDIPVMIETTVTLLLLYFVITIPITSKVHIDNSESIPEEVMNIFLVTVLFIVIVGVLISDDYLLIPVIDSLFSFNANEIIISMMIITDIILIIFFIPSIFVLKYIEIKVIEPILSFSKIEDYIHENEKIESDEIVEIYLEYINEKTEIGTLARSYTNLINFNNSYIENIHEVTYHPIEANVAPTI